MTLKERIVNTAKRAGADLVGFADVERFDLPEGNVVRKIYPDCKTVIGIGMRVLRGSLRGVEEGTNYFQFHMAGVDTLEFKIMPEKARRVCALLEDEGFEGLAQIRHPSIRQDENLAPDVYYRSVRSGCAPENQMDFRHAAVLCGMGELGMSGHVLTEEFGPLARFCYVLTDAEIEPDPVKPRSLCDGCGRCRKECHTRYALRETTKDVVLGGETYRVFDYDEWICNAYYHGANRTKNPWMRPDALSDIPDREAVIRGEKDLTRAEVRELLEAIDGIYVPKKPEGAEKKLEVIGGKLHSALCGLACDRACYVHLEEENRMGVKYVNRFRPGEDWHLDADN